MTERRLDGKWQRQVTALYDYKPEQSDELGFYDGDVIQVLRLQDDGWWFGYNVKNPDAVGLFPSNYVQALKTDSPVRGTKSFVLSAPSTPQDLESARQWKDQQFGNTFNTSPELQGKYEGDGEVIEKRSELHGHVKAKVQLQQSFEEAEQASRKVRVAQQQAEWKSLRRKNSWRERNYDNNTEQLLHGGSGSNTEDRDESVILQRQGAMHEIDHDEDDRDSSTIGNIIIKDEVRRDENRRVFNTKDVKFAAATLIAKSYRRHIQIIRANYKWKNKAEHEKSCEAAAAKIARKYFIHRKLTTVCQREKEAAAYIQKWIRMRWAHFYCKRAHIECQTRNRANAQHITRTVFGRQARGENQLRQVVYTKEKGRHSEQSAENERMLQQTIEEVEQQLCQVQVNVCVLDSKGLKNEEDEQHDAAILISTKAAALTPDKPHRKVMKKEAVKLIKMLVQQQLNVTLRDHDAKIDDLQRLVVKLQTLVRKQTVMLENSANQLVHLQIRQQEVKLPGPRRSSGTDGSFLPKVSEKSPNFRQSIAPSGLRAPRPVIMSKLPVLTRGNQTNRMGV